MSPMALELNINLIATETYSPDNSLARFDIFEPQWWYDRVGKFEPTTMYHATLLAGDSSIEPWDVSQRRTLKELASDIMQELMDPEEYQSLSPSDKSELKFRLYSIIQGQRISDNLTIPDESQTFPPAEVTKEYYETARNLTPEELAEVSRFLYREMQKIHPTTESEKK